MERIVSSDGTTLAYERSGEGPPLLVIGGALANHRFYVPLASALAADFTVFNFDRRGRGASGGAAVDDIAREVEDVAALVRVESRPVFVYAHSAGAALALRAAAAGIPMARLALADPPFSPRSRDDRETRAAFARELAGIEKMQAAGDFRGSARVFLRSMGLSDADVDGILDSPMGEGMIDCARALLRDYRLLGDGLVPTEIAASVGVPTAVLVPASPDDAAEQLVAALRDARLVTTGAPAHETSPDDMARTLREFFLRTG